MKCPKTLSGNHKFIHSHDEDEVSVYCEHCEIVNDVDQVKSLECCQWEVERDEINRRKAKEWNNRSWISKLFNDDLP